MFDNIIKLIRETIDNDLRPKSKKCEEFLETVIDETTRHRLQVKYGQIDNEIDRLSSCLDILNGNAYTIIDDVVGLEVVIPKRGIVAEAIKMGAKVTSVETNIVTITEGKCPNCGANIQTENEQPIYCDNCGMLVNWQDGEPYIDDKGIIPKQNKLL